SRAQGKESVEPGQIAGGIFYVKQVNAAIGQVFARAPGVLAIMAFARENDDKFSGPGQSKGMGPDGFPDSPDDFRLRLTGGPAGLLPISHLSNADYRQRHGGKLASRLTYERRKNLPETYSHRLQKSRFTFHESPFKSLFSSFPIAYKILRRPLRN